MNVPDFVQGLLCLRLEYLLDIEIAGKTAVINNPTSSLLGQVNPLDLTLSSLQVLRSIATASQ